MLHRLADGAFGLPHLGGIADGGDNAGIHSEARRQRADLNGRIERVSVASCQFQVAAEPAEALKGFTEKFDEFLESLIVRKQRAGASAHEFVHAEAEDGSNGGVAGDDSLTVLIADEDDILDRLESRFEQLSGAFRAQGRRGLASRKGPATVPFPGPNFLRQDGRE